MIRRRSYGIAGIEIRVETDDAEFLDEFAGLCGDASPGPPRAVLDACLLAGEGEEARLALTGDDLLDAAEFVLSMASPTLPFEPGPPDPRGATVAIEGPSPLLVFGHGLCYVRKIPRWRRILAHVVFLRALRLRDDALFFHAASVSVHGRGLMLVGPKGSGKTTLAMALGARGHAVLGDETAAYAPASRELLPMRRPARIKPGPRSRAIERMVRAGAFPMDQDGRLSAPLERLFGDAAAARLDAVAFLRGFAQPSQVMALEAGRKELRSLQPLAPTLHRRGARSVLDMAALLSAARCYAVCIGDVDGTASLLEAAVLTSRTAVVRPS